MYDPSKPLEVKAYQVKIFWVFIKVLIGVAALAVSVGSLVVVWAWAFKFAPILVVILIICGVLWVVEKSVKEDAANHDDKKP